MDYNRAILALCVLLFYVIFKRISHIGKRPKGYPPGPPTLPLLGNLHQIPSSRVHKQFQRWADQYGPVYSLILGTRVMIVLSSDQAVKDLLDKRSSIYSSRPEYYMGQEILSGNSRFVHFKYDETWKLVRKLGQKLFSLKASEAYIPYQDLESKAMLLDFLQEPQEYKLHVQRYTGSLASQMTFGVRATSTKDPMLRQAFSILERHFAIAASPTAALLDSFPILRKLPDAILPKRREGRDLYREEHDMWLKTCDDGAARLNDDRSVEYFCADLERLREESGVSRDLAADFGGNLFQANSETTASILVGLVQAFVIFPDVVKKAQQELDRVCGTRLPSLNDRPNLPWIRGIAKETLRWMPGALTGIPHSVISDDQYMGYLIPKGAVVMYNTWAIHNDSNRHANPRDFDPSRWKDDEQTSAEAAANADVSKRDHFAYGAGRRLCPGIHIADRSIFLAAARLLWAFDFDCLKGANGSKIVPDRENLTDGLFCLPKPFPADIRPRTGKADLIRSEWAKAAERLDEDGQWRSAPGVEG